MDTEQNPSSPRPRRGMAMFAVLGAIVVVTLLGAVGLTMAQKDQQLSGDFSALKSADEMGLAGLRLAVNRLESDPANLVALLNAFIQSKGAKPWLDLSGATVTLQSSAPSPAFKLNADPSGAKVSIKILAVAPGDTGSFPTMDSSNVYITLECQAEGAQGDQRKTSATYHVQGVSLAFSSGIRQFRIPDYAFYLGGTLQTSNLEAEIKGDVYINGSDGTFFNGGASHNIHGALKWNGDYASNTALTVDSSVFINGSLTLNGSAPLTFSRNLGVSGGLRQMNSKLTVLGNLWVGSAYPTPATGSWNSGGKIDVRGDMVFVPSGAMTAGDAISVLGNAWFMTGINTNGSAPVSIGGSLFLHDSGGFTPASSAIGPLTVGRNLIVSMLPNAGRKLAINGTANRVRDTMASLLQITGGTIRVDSQAYAAGSVIVVDSGRRTTRGFTKATIDSLYARPPTPAWMGLDSFLQNTSVAGNPMDSVKLDSINSPEAYSRIVEVTPQLLRDANISSNVMSPSTLNRLYAYLDSTRRTFNGYMVLRLGAYASSAFTSSTDDVSGFTGKAIYLVTASNTNLTYWPHSQTKANIQIIDIQHNGELGAWGWTYGDFAGMFYWSDPSVCSGKTFNFPNTGFFYGSIIIGNATTCTGPKITPNKGKIQLVRDIDVYADIGVNLPGLLRPAKVNGFYRNMTTMPVKQMTSLVRLTTSKPFFQTVAIYR